MEGLSSEPNNHHLSYLFNAAPSPPSNSMLPLLPLNHHQQQPMQNNSINSQTVPNSDQIDWIALLSGSGDFMPNINNGDHQKPPPEEYCNAMGGESTIGGSRNCRGGRGGGGGRSKKRGVPPRIAFHTRSSEDILDDGYKWRKYGQKAVKNSVHPRSYYRCTHHTCSVKKQIQRLSKDMGIVVTTYEGIHNHPCEKLMETLTPLLKQLQFLSRF